MLARDQIVDVLDQHLSDTIDVIPYARQIDPPKKPTVMVRIDKVRPSPHASSQWEVDGALVLIASQTTPGKADDELETLLEDVLWSLDQPDLAEALRWSEATRATYGEPDPTNPAYEVLVTTQMSKPPTDDPEPDPEP